MKHKKYEDLFRMISNIPASLDKPDEYRIYLMQINSRNFPFKRYGWAVEQLRAFIEFPDVVVKCTN